MIKSIIVIFFITCNFAHSQTVTFLEKNDTLRKPSYKEFTFLNDSTDISRAVYVAKIKSEGSLKHPGELYEKIKAAAQTIGANTFRFESFSITNDGGGQLVLSAYYCDNIILGINYQNIPRDKVIIFGDDDLLQYRLQTFKVDGVKHEVHTGHYKVFDIPDGQTLTFSKGGFTGAATKIKGIKGRQNIFLSLTGFGPAGPTYEPTNMGVGVSFTTGKIKPVEENLALLLMKVFNIEE